MSVRGSYIAALVGLALAPAAARAADMPAVQPIDVAIANAAHDWSGIYAGVNVGGALGEFQSFTPGPSTGDFDGNGALGGFQIGYNKQFGSVVIGVEGDFQGANIDGDGSTGGVPTSASLDWFSTARGRVGYAFDRTLIYGTAGGVAAGLETTAGGVSDNQTAWGWTAGAGVEHSVTENISLKAEYLYLDTKEETFDTAPTTNNEWDGHVMRFGANLKF
ncbi:outer membrane protein [Flaviflagellibacter deserti]|uniref:Outer membrane protein n=1 Tax=Flaviflagellibacter deserti TaxID=2267266 RepID=A0ABV9YZ79_9HYPH